MRKTNCCSFESLSALYARLFTTNSFSMSFTTYQQLHLRIIQNVAIIQMLLSTCACSVAFLLTAFASLLIYIYMQLEIFCIASCTTNVTQRQRKHKHTLAVLTSQHALVVPGVTFLSTCLCSVAFLPAATSHGGVSPQSLFLVSVSNTANREGIFT